MTGTRNAVAFMSAFLLSLTLVSCENATESTPDSDAGPVDAASNDAEDAADGPDSGELDSGVVRPECTEPDECGQLAEFVGLDRGTMMLAHHNEQGMTVLGSAGFERYIFQSGQAALRDIVSLGVTPFWAESIDDLAIIFGSEDDGQHGLMVYDLGYWPPRRIAQMDGSSLADKRPVCAFDNYIVLGSPEEISLLDLSSPDAPVVVASTPHPEDRRLTCTGNEDSLRFMLAESDFDGSDETVTLEYGQIELNAFAGGLPTTSVQVVTFPDEYLGRLQMASLGEDLYLAANAISMEDGERRGTVWSVNPASGAIGDEILEGESVALWQSRDSVIVSRPGEARLVASAQGESWAVSWSETDGVALDVHRDSERARVVLQAAVLDFEPTGTPATQTLVADLNREDTSTNLDVALVGSVAWIARGTGGVVGVQLCAASEPWEITRLLEHPTDRVLGSDHWLVAVDASAGVLPVYDVADPEQPVEIAALAEDLTRVALDGSILLVMDGAELAVFDLASDKPSRAVGAVELWGPERDDVGGERMIDRGLDLHDGSALVAYAPFFFEVDVSDPTHPVPVGEVYAELGGREIMVTDRYFGIDLFFYDRQVFFDMGESEETLETFHISEAWTAADEGDGIVYVADSNSGGFQMYDVSGDDLVLLATALGTAGNPSHLSVSDGRAVALDRGQDKAFTFEAVCQ